MSVDAINGANAQQQPQKHSALPGAIASGIGLGAVGAGAGYFLGGKRPTLEQVFEQTPDTFTKKEVTEKDAEAAKKLQDAVTEYKDVNVNGEVGKANKAVYDSVQAQKLENQADLDNAIQKAKGAFVDKDVDINGKRSFAEIKASIKKAHESMEKATTDEAKKAAKEELKKALDDRKAFLDATKEERSALAKAKNEVRKAKIAQFVEKAKTEANAEHGYADALTKAQEKLTKARADKKTELLAKDEIKQAFEKIKDALPKEGKGKMAMLAGGIAAAVGLIGGYLMNSGHSDKA